MADCLRGGRVPFQSKKRVKAGSDEDDSMQIDRPRVEDSEDDGPTRPKSKSKKSSKFRTAFVNSPRTIRLLRASANRWLGLATAASSSMTRTPIRTRRRRLKRPMPTSRHVGSVNTVSLRGLSLIHRSLRVTERKGGLDEGGS